ncbi:Odorant receptor 237 [Nylanderia fulva]|uniref:Odorant receptor n=2 Tax=Nylanderia fulva TaxID=613905 RepID=A0A6G1LQL0_9HYME|nr:Odorant receptor 237 [Nylanderia fulva]
MYANKHYENDIKYTMQLNRIIGRLLGVWPSMDTKSSNFKNLSRILHILTCYFLLACELIPTILYVIVIEKRPSVKLKLASSAMFTTTAVLKYSILVFTQNQIRNCLMRVRDDWQNVASPRARQFMIDKVRTARRLILLCGLFMYSAGLYFRTFVPLTKGKSINDRNITIRFLPCPSYFIYFDGQISPAYEIMFTMQFLSGFIKYTITVTICSLAALFAMHLCAQLEILMSLINDYVNESDEKKLTKRLATAVKYQTDMRTFFQLVQNTLGNTNLLEVMGCTLLVCLLGHNIITEWEDQDVIALFLYLVLLTSIGFNIFIFCFIGEQLSEEGEKLSLTVCTLAWYRLPDMNKARSLVLIIAMSNIPTKLKAGKFIDLSIKTFGDVVKTAVTYLNIIRRVME